MALYSCTTSSHHVAREVWPGIAFNMKFCQSENFGNCEILPVHGQRGKKSGEARDSGLERRTEIGVIDLSP